MPGGIAVRKDGIRFNFCPGKATWSHDVVALFDQCRVAVQTGILPRVGGLEEQDAEFYEVFPMFTDVWKKRTYQDIWKDVRRHIRDTLVATGLVKARGHGTGD